MIITYYWNVKIYSLFFVHVFNKQSVAFCLAMSQKYNLKMCTLYVHVHRLHWHGRNTEL